jgi:hypothetical protein
MDRGMIWIATGQMTEVDDRRRITGDGSQEMDHVGWMTINFLPFYEDMEVMQCYSILEITNFDFKLRRCNAAQICRYTMYCRLHSSTEYSTKHYSEHYSNIPKYAAYSGVRMPNMIPKQILSHSYKADYSHLEAVTDKLSAKQ